MTGRVTTELEAQVTVRVAVGDGTTRDLSATIDTGFNGYMTIPSPLAEQLKLPICGHIDAQLGDGRTVRMPACEIRIDWFGKWREVLVLTSDAGVLIGMSLLRGHRVAIDVERGGEVTVTPR